MLAILFLFKLIKNSNKKLPLLVAEVFYILTDLVSRGTNIG